MPQTAGWPPGGPLLQTRQRSWHDSTSDPTRTVTVRYDYEKGRKRNEFAFDPQQDVDVLRRHAAAWCGVATEDLRLALGGRILSGGMLADYGVQRGAQIAAWSSGLLGGGGNNDGGGDDVASDDDFGDAAA